MTRNRQIALFDADETVWEIKKHSSIVQIWNMTTMQERKAMNALIWIAKDILKRTPDERVFQTDIGIVKTLCGLNDTSNNKLKNALRSLADTKIEYNIFDKDKSDWGIFSFLASARIREQGRWKATFVTFEFPSMVLDVIKHPKMFVRLNLLIIRGLDSKHSIALYEFLKDYLNLWKFRCMIGDFRAMMGIQPHQYRSFTMVRKRVLEIAIEEINSKTDIEVSYDLEKQGKKIAAIIFKMRPKSNAITGIEQHDKIKDKLKAFWIKDKRIETLLEKHDEEYLRANIAIVEQQITRWKVKNPTGYLLKAFDNAYSESTTDFEKQAEQKKVEHAKRTEEELEIAKEQKKVKIDFQNWKKNKIDKQLSLIETIELESLKAEFTERITENSLFLKMLQTKGFEHPVIQIEWYKYLEPKLLAEDDVDFEIFKDKISKQGKAAT